MEATAGRRICVRWQSNYRKESPLRYRLVVRHYVGDIEEFLRELGGDLCVELLLHRFGLFWRQLATEANLLCKTCLEPNPEHVLEPIPNGIGEPSDDGVANEAFDAFA